MIIRRKVLWVIGMIAIVILLTSVSSSASVKLRKSPRKSTNKVSYQQQSRVGPLIIKVIHKYSDNELIHGLSSNYTPYIRGDVRDKLNSSDYENFDINSTHFGQNDPLPKERYIVYPKKYEHFVSKKNIGRMNRHKRNITISELRFLNASDQAELSNDDNVSGKVVKNETKGKLKKVTLQQIHKHIKIKNTSKSVQQSKALIDEHRNLSKRSIDNDNTDCHICDQRYGKVSRTKRSFVNEYLPRRNSSDYYAQRRAVMERYYARQREINARYANRTSDISRLKYNNVTSQNQSAESNASLFRLGHEYPNKDATVRDNATFRQPPITIDPIYSNESENNRIQTKLDSRQDIVAEIDPDFKFDTGLSQTRNTSNVERNALDYYVTPTPCTNIPLSGTFAPKTRWKQNKTDDEAKGTTHHFNRTVIANNSNHQIWGHCEGKIVYQHNLLLGVKGPSNLDAVFEIIIQGPVCITCVETLRYNETRAIVSLDSGGRGYEYAKLKLKGYENEGFSYIIKVWGIRKIGQDCDNIN